MINIKRFEELRILNWRLYNVINANDAGLLKEVDFLKVAHSDWEDIQSAANVLGDLISLLPDKPSKEGIMIEKDLPMQ